MSLNTQIKLTDNFQKQFKKLYKKDKGLVVEYERLLENLKNDIYFGTKISDDIYKIRLKNSSNNKGKSAGYRVITYTKIENILFLIAIYSKSDIANISEKLLDKTIANIKA